MKEKLSLNNASQNLLILVFLRDKEFEIPERILNLKYDPSRFDIEKFQIKILREFKKEMLLKKYNDPFLKLFLYLSLFLLAIGYQDELIKQVVYEYIEDNIKNFEGEIHEKLIDIFYSDFTKIVK